MQDALSRKTELARTAVDPVAPQAKPFDFDRLKGRPNLHQTPLGARREWSLEKLLALTQAEGVELWRGLDAVGMREMDGHYMGYGPDALSEAFQLGYANYMYDETSPRGYWLGKAFRPLTDTTGEGYNRWRFAGGKVARNLRMATRMGVSLIDGKPCYVLDYSVFNPKMTLVDELRKLDETIYLGIATRDAGDGKRDHPDFFVLVGPTDEWVGAETPA